MATLKFLAEAPIHGRVFEARIKKIMQADEDVGKSSMALPLLVCTIKALRGSIMEAKTQDLKEQILPGKAEEAPIGNFDLNVVLDENGDLATVAAGSAISSPEPVPEMKHDEYHRWSLSDMEKMAIEPIQLASLSRKIDEDEEDYDEEG
ncbi:uncharacterized protein LOC121240887 [Juglans microcarpa x Juglans regia]|uniref:uncharacterized protein LOC121240887 n=1 Tax=Juglans microcarpa x Juglans regia TaxID=2249226 RepID=UPI001B7F629C|nr:uncharacterized protein LOC121240887 [Juglans microcarpa x Juglans regia]